MDNPGYSIGGCCLMKEGMPHALGQALSVRRPRGVAIAVLSSMQHYIWIRGPLGHALQSRGFTHS